MPPPWFNETLGDKAFPFDKTLLQCSSNFKALEITQLAILVLFAIFVLFKLRKVVIKRTVWHFVFLISIKVCFVFVLIVE